MGKIIILSSIILLCQSCSNQVEGNQEQFFREGKMFQLVCSVESSPDTDQAVYTNTYYISSSHDELLSIQSVRRKNTMVADTTSYVFSTDSIYNMKNGHFYIVKNELIVAKSSRIPGKLIGFLYDNDRRLVKEGHISSIVDTLSDANSYIQYLWEEGQLRYGVSLLDKTDSIKIGYDKFSSNKQRFGSLHLYSYELLSWEELPFIILGYFGKLPQGNVKEIVRTKIEEKPYCKFENTFDSGGNLQDGYISRANLTQEYSWGEGFENQGNGFPPSVEQEKDENAGAN